MTTTSLTRRIEGSVTTISWIPSEAVEGAYKAGFKLGVTHYDPAPPDDLGPDIDAALDELVATDRLRFANHLRAWAEFDDHGGVVAYGHLGGGKLGATNVHIGTDVCLGASAMPERRGEPETGPGWVRFTQTNGGRTGAPMPRPVRRAPFVQFKSPVAWTTLELTLHADGRVEGRLDRRLSLPPPLGLRHGRHAHRQEREHRLEGLGRYRLRQAHAMGRRGLTGVRDGCRDGARTGPLGPGDAWRQQARGAQAPAGEVLTRQGDVGGELFLAARRRARRRRRWYGVGRGRPRRRARRASGDRTGPRAHPH